MAAEDAVVRFTSVGRIALLSMALALVALGATVTNPRSSIWRLPAIGGWWVIGFVGIGFVIARRQPRNPIGWLLALVYAPGVFVIQSILPGEQTGLAVATSTRAVAGLLTPLGLPIQRVVDHRFNHSHDDAELVIEEFFGGLRNQMALGAVASGLRVVLDRTIQPDTTEIWLRGQP